jgi:hypothetical protein
MAALTAGWVIYNQGKSSPRFLGLVLKLWMDAFPAATQIYLSFDLIQIHLKRNFRLFPYHL